MSTDTGESRYDSMIAAFAGARIGVLGDLAADVYVSGYTERVSREAPVLILRYERKWTLPGCAANTAANVRALGASVELVGLLGEDRGDEFTLDKIETMDIDYDAAMVKRAAIHAAIKEELDERAAKKARLATPPLTSVTDTRHRPVLMAVATSGAGLVN